MHETLKLGLILGLICAIAGGSLAIVHNITDDIIVARREQDLNNNLRKLAPLAERFDKVEPDDGSVYYVGWQEDDIVGTILEGTAKGYGGDMRLLVSVDAAGAISGITVVDHSETIGIGTRTLTPEYLAQYYEVTYDEKLVAGENVDMITGATASSRAVLATVNNALALYRTHVLEITVADINIKDIVDGTYEGVGQGLSDIKVAVEIANGAITKVTVLSHNESDGISDLALEQIPLTIVAEQSVKIDAISGATLASQGIIDAVMNALEKAPTR